MSLVIPADSVGIVSPRTLRISTPVRLACGRDLPQLDLVYETYGQLNAQKTNAVLICHALSGDHHAAGYHHIEDKKAGWWDYYIGPGKPIDTNKFFVVAMNNIGGCAGSTGPASINAETGRPWGADFPLLRVRDWVATQKLLMDHLEIACWAAVVGGSLGGMQAMRWCVDFPDRLRHCVISASALKLTAQNIAFNEVARRAITTDPDWCDGHYLVQGKVPRNGLAIARMIGHITYLSDDAMGEKFGRELRSGSFDVGTDTPVEFQIQSYLRHQGESFSTGFDANTYVLMTQALDYFDLAREFDHDAAKAFMVTQSSFFITSFTSDWRFSTARSQEIVNALIRAKKKVCYAEIEAHHGHDAFLIPIPRYQEVFHAYMQGIHL